ncbi:E3 ubiquitin-protein ligase RNF34 isoform X2 [Pangasianodon hypophthalmus]|uniref:E3 ubiquitin-protein ligase RNF34 isoform X2 n=1 Tax=Pangasianodon hypophthalmus TaxID=310915 RepID=UPI00230753FC|nr:E3 ubiquitin-protein ligase RNF34 isoform X2 [Pangasianodon hypophthalmus]
MKASMWASCCGLLNDLIGSGAVRGHQAGFGSGAGPFRFAPGAGYSAYPSTSSTQSPSSPAPSNGAACKACGLAFSVFRRKHVCSDCGRSFCALCSVLQENLRRCCVCHALWATAFERARLMRLRVRDLRRYLTLRDISTDACTEKEELVELVLQHMGVDLQEEEEEEEEEESEEANTEAPPSDLALPVDAAPATPQQPALSVSAPQEETHSTNNSSGTSQDCGDVASVSLLPLENNERLLESSPVTQRRARASISDLSSEDDIELLTVRQLKEILARNFVNFSGCCEKWELVERVQRLYREHQHNRTSLENMSNSITAGVAPLSTVDENVCRICMDAVIDCVLLECGHMITCTRCGKKMNECPICRQYVVRAVHVFKS